MKKSTYAENLLVSAAGQEEVLFILIGVKLDAVGDLFEVKLTGTLARLSVPQFDEAIVGSREELGSQGVEGDIANSLSMANIGTDKTAVVV